MVHVQAPAIRSAEKRKTRKNYYRFYPGRPPRVMHNGKTDDRLLFESAIYARITDQQQTLDAGIVVGPTLEHILGQETLQGGSGLVSARAVNRSGEIIIPDVRKWPVPKTTTLKTFIDLLTLRRNTATGQLEAVPLENEGQAWFEICTGDPQEGEGAYIAALSGQWIHGSAQYLGAQTPIVSAPSTRRGKKVKKDTTLSNEMVEDTEAEEPAFSNSLPLLWGEKVGTTVNGAPLWWTRVFGVQFSPKDSEVVIVRQVNKYYQCYMRDGRGVYRDCTAKKGIEQEYVDNIERLAQVGIATTPLIVPPGGQILTAETATATAA